jgi:hypothetical protein
VQGNPGSGTYDVATGYFIGGLLFASFQEAGGVNGYGHPLGPPALYSDGAHRLVEELVVQEAYPDGTVRGGGLGQAYVATTGLRLPTFGEIVALG